MDKIWDQNRQEDVPSDLIFPGDAGRDGFTTFDITGLASNKADSLTGMKDEIAILSWLIVLLRVREDTQVSFEWTYKLWGNESGPNSVNRCSSTEVISGLQNTVGDAATAISRQITKVVSSQCARTSTSFSLLLSTGSLLRTSEMAEDEVSERTLPSHGR